jgi:hypothetical protein
MKASKPVNMAVIASVGFCLLVFISTAEAQEENWEFTADLYFWYASMGGESATGSNIDIDASDIIDALEFGYMGVLEARKGKWSLLTDVIYLDLGADSGGIDVGLQGWIVTPAVGYNLIQEENLTLDILGGARFLWLKSTLDLSGIGGPRLSDSGDVWDGIVGLKGELNLSKSWSMPFYLDVGSGDSDMTWQALGGLAYKLDTLDVLVGYRYLAWDFDDNDVFDDLNISGPYAGLKLRF